MQPSDLTCVACTRTLLPDDQVLLIEQCEHFIHTACSPIPGAKCPIDGQLLDLQLLSSATPCSFSRDCGARFDRLLDNKHRSHNRRNIGWIFLNDRADHKKAVAWFRKAAKGSNNANALLDLAQCYSKGWGVASSQKEAEKLTQRAAPLIEELRVRNDAFLHGDATSEIQEDEITKTLIASVENAQQSEIPAMAEADSYELTSHKPVSGFPTPMTSDDTSGDADQDRTPEQTNLCSEGEARSQIHLSDQLLPEHRKNSTSTSSIQTQSEPLEGFDQPTYSPSASKDVSQNGRNGIIVKSTAAEDSRASGPTPSIKGSPSQQQLLDAPPTEQPIRPSEDGGSAPMQPVLSSANRSAASKSLYLESAGFESTILSVSKDLLQLDARVQHMSPRSMLTQTMNLRSTSSRSSVGDGCKSASPPVSKIMGQHDTMQSLTTSGGSSEGKTSGPHGDNQSPSICSAHSSVRDCTSFSPAMSPIAAAYKATSQGNENYIEHRFNDLQSSTSSEVTVLQSSGEHSGSHTASDDAPHLTKDNPLQHLVSESFNLPKNTMETMLPTESLTPRPDLGSSSADEEGELLVVWGGAAHEASEAPKTSERSASQGPFIPRNRARADARYAQASLQAGSSVPIPTQEHDSSTTNMSVLLNMPSFAGLISHLPPVPHPTAAQPSRGMRKDTGVDPALEKQIKQGRVLALQAVKHEEQENVAEAEAKYLEALSLLAPAIRELETGSELTREKRMKLKDKLRREASTITSRCGEFKSLLQTSGVSEPQSGKKYVLGGWGPRNRRVEGQREVTSSSGNRGGAMGTRRAGGTQAGTEMALGGQMETSAADDNMSSRTLAQFDMWDAHALDRKMSGRGIEAAAGAAGGAEAASCFICRKASVMSGTCGHDFCASCALRSAKVFNMCPVPKCEGFISTVTPL